MNYELAKELKDAGFPQTGKGSFLILKPADVGMSTASQTMKYVPTLSELIEACGVGNFILRNDLLTEAWHAQKDNDRKICCGGNGSTPEEAVARLWLALNKK